MNHPAFASNIAYACIFSTSVDDATANLLRLIRSGAPGWLDGAAWRNVLTEYLDSSGDLSELNRFGARFSETEWRAILEQVRAGLPGPGTVPPVPDA